jgi:hypothetical protein
MCGRRREKETFLISKPRNKLSKKKKYNSAQEIICVCKKRPHLNKSKRGKWRERETAYFKFILSLLK